MRKRLLSIILALCVTLTALPVSVLASEEIPETDETAAITSEDAESQVQEDTSTSNTPIPTTEPKETMEPTPLLEDVQESGTCGENLTWTLENGTLIISGTGAMDDYDCQGQNRAPWGNYDIDRIVIQDGVISIGSWAFYDCCMTNIEFSNSVAEIGNNAFYRCINLISIEIPNGVTNIGSYIFYGCSNLTSIKIPNSVTKIKDNAFFGCRGLTDIEIPDSVTSIDHYAFGCSGLTSIEIPSSVIYIGENLFMDCDSLENIKVSADNLKYDSRNNCNAIIETVSNTLVRGCKNTKILNSITSIGDNAFSSCNGLTNIEIPDSITRIGDSAFAHCSDLTNIEIPNSITTIESGTFTYCSSLIDIKVPNTVTRIGDSAFANCSSLANIEIPNSVTSIGGGVFAGCSNLTNIEIPSSVTSIGSSAFSGCKNLGGNVKIPVGMVSIEYGVFYHCENLASIEIPDSVIGIEESAFDNCNNLHDVYYEGSETKWRSINIDIGNDCLTNANIHYSSISPDDESNKPAKPPVPTDTDLTNTGILTFKDVRYYDTIARTYVDIDLTWNWNDLLTGNSNTPNVNLAKMGLALSATIEGTNFREDTNNILICTDTVKRLMCDEVTYVEEISPDMAIGIKQIKTEGETKNIIFVVLSGTKDGTWDWANDALSSVGITHWGINPVTDKLVAQLTEWEKTYGNINRDNTKFFITGHSLGGACANLLAAKLSEEYGMGNVFGYTFAAPSPFDDANDILDEFEDISKFRRNINNFLCVQDYVPSHFNRRDEWWGSGYPRWFNMCTQTKAADIYYHLTKGKQWWDTHNANQGSRFSVGLHAPSAYMAYLIADPHLKTSDVTNYICVKCPVNVEVYNSSNELVGRIVNDEIDYDHYAPNVKLIVCDGAKYVYFLNDDTYTIKIIGTGEGTMTYTAASKDINSDIDIDKETKIYSNVRISTGKKFRSVVSSYDATNANDIVKIPDVKLSVVDDNENIVAQVLSDTEASASEKENGTEIPVNNSDINSGGSIPGNSSGGSVPIYYPVTTVKPENNTNPTNNRPENNNTAPTDEGAETSAKPEDNNVNPTDDKLEDDNTNPADEDLAVKVKKIKISGLSHKIAVGKQIALVATISPANADDKAVIWKSSNTKYATVNKNGLVNLKKAGKGKTVTITATASDGSGKKASYKIKCMKGVVKNVTVAGRKNRSLKAGESMKLKTNVTATRGSNKMLQWTSSNTKYASVTSRGKVVAKKAGKGKTVKITAMATDGSGKKASVKIKIK